VSLDAQLADVEAVLEAELPGTFDVLGFFDASAIAIATAARHADRVRKLVLWYPLIDGAEWIPSDRVRSLVQLARTDWPLALRTLSTLWAPRAPAEYQRALTKGFSETLEPDVFVAYLQATQQTNVSAEAAQVRAATLILTPSGAGLPAQFAQQAASLISKATLQLVEQELPVAAGGRGADMILQFLDGARAPTAAPAGTAIILFADIVDSTALTERMGDAGFRERARTLDASLREIISSAGGTAIDGKLLGDGVLATFPAAAQAIDGALRCADAGGRGGLPLHLGIHAGDVIREANNVFGGAVNIASRISGLSAPGEVLVSDVVRALARTSASVTFEDRGEHALKGVGEPQRVFAVHRDVQA
jgi:class 3 adenylate cyclase